MCLKIDLKKAFDSVTWDLIVKALQAMKFPAGFINLIMQCIQKPAFSVLLNGKSCGYFNSSCGLRQGCLLSPYLFSIVMEFLSSKLSEKNVELPSTFCKGNMAISHLFFTDDVMIFSAATVDAANHIQEALSQFSASSGLSINREKSSLFVCNSDSQVENIISSIINISKAEFPIRYLGLPLFSTQLTLQDCMPLTDKLKSRLAKWKSNLQD